MRVVSVCVCSGFWIAADDAFKPAKRMMTPYPGDLKCTQTLAGNGRTCREQLLDGHHACSNCIKSWFNFWLSNSRITIECAPLRAGSPILTL